MNKVEGIKADINRLSALLWAEEKRITDENSVILFSSAHTRVDIRFISALNPSTLFI